MYLTTRGLVLRVTAYKDKDALLTLLTPSHGKLTVKARGLYRKNSPLAAPCQLLVYGEFTLFEYRSMYTVNEAHCIELFTPLRRDLQKLSLGTYFAQVSELISQEDAPNPELLSLVLNCLYGLSSLNICENQIKTVFELRVMCLAGYEPDVSTCHICENPQVSYFDISQGCVVCNRCMELYAGGIRMPVSAGMCDAMRYICHCPSKKLFSFSLPDGELQALSQLSETYLVTQLERGFPTLDFYKSLIYQGDIPF